MDVEAFVPHSVMVSQINAAVLAECEACAKIADYERLRFAGLSQGEVCGLIAAKIRLRQRDDRKRVVNETGAERKRGLRAAVFASVTSHGYDAKQHVELLWAVIYSLVDEIEEGRVGAEKLQSALALYVEHFGDPLKVARAALDAGKPFECANCGARFASEGDLAAHQESEVQHGA